MTRTIGLASVGLIEDERFQEFNLLHYQVENRLLRLIEKIEAKRDDEDWIARIAEDESEYLPGPGENPITPALHHSITPISCDA